MRISDLSSDVCSSDLVALGRVDQQPGRDQRDQDHGQAEIDGESHPFQSPTHFTYSPISCTRRGDGPSPARQRSHLFGETASTDRKSVVSGKSVSVRLDHGGRRSMTKKKKKQSK